MAEANKNKHDEFARKMVEISKGKDYNRLSNSAQGAVVEAVRGNNYYKHHEFARRMAEMSNDESYKRLPNSAKGAVVEAVKQFVDLNTKEQKK